MFLALFLLCLVARDTLALEEVFQDISDINVALVLNKCRNKSSVNPHNTHNIVNSAIWTTQRINYLEFGAPLSFGLTVYKTCSDKDDLNAIFKLYNASDENYLLGVISEEWFEDKTNKLSDVLNVNKRILPKVFKYMVKSTVEFFSMMNWYENVTVVVNNERILREVYTYTTRKFICVNNYVIWRNTQDLSNKTFETVVFFGDKEDITTFLKENKDYTNLLIVPVDGSVPKGLPENAFVQLPNYGPLSKFYKKNTNIIPTPDLFKVANPLLTFAQTVEYFIRDYCNDTLYKLNCMRSKFHNTFPRLFYTPHDILELLKIQTLEEHFVYNVFLVENSTETENLKKNNYVHPYTKIFTYNILTEKWFLHNASIFLDNLEAHNDSEEFCKSNSDYCINNCKNYLESISEDELFILTAFSEIRIRTDSWVYAFLSLSVLGILFCIAILVFILISICRRDILEGNPSLTVALLIAIMLMFMSVLPFCINVTSASAKETVCLLKTLSITLTFALAFALLLSRCILLASASKEIGFMSHIAGSVQSFLSLFIFGVQAALSLQVIGRCSDIWRGQHFLFLMSYNAMLLLLLLCLCPLIYKCQRNYREGKYFVIAVCLTTIVWCIWIPLYGCLRRDWREPLLCFGVVSTAGIFLGSLFIPRTYLMTIAAARDKITSRLPSLATATSAIDIYRANTQPVYDCVNVAAINAVNVARAGVVGTTIQQPDLYSCPALPDEDDLDFRCDSPLNTDKVTRF